MNLCNNGHDEVCFECRDCPVCEKINEITDLESDVSGLVNDIDKLNARIDELEMQN